MEELASELEQLNPHKNALASPLISAKWRLLYTTSASILGTSKPPFLRPIGPIYQTIDAVNLTARNEETWPFFNQVGTRQTTYLYSSVIAYSANRSSANQLYEVIWKPAEL